MTTGKTNISLESSFVIEIKLKTLIIAIATIISGIWGFNSKFIEPKFESVNVQFKSIETKQDLYYNELLNIKSGIGVLQGTINGMDKRIDDLKSTANPQAGQSGSFNKPPVTQ